MILVIHTYSPLLWGLELIKSGDEKNKVVSEAIDDENLIIFLWEVAADILSGTQSLKLLQEYLSCDMP